MGSPYPGRESEIFKTARGPPSIIRLTTTPEREADEVKAQLDLIGIVVEDMGRALAFYRELGLEIPEDGDGQPHVEATLPGGLRLAWDTAETIRSFNPEWQPATGGPQIGLAFLVDSPAGVDAAYERLARL